MKLSWQSQKNRNLNVLDKKKRKAAIIVHGNRKPKTKFEKTLKPWKTLKPKNREPNIGQTRKIENPNVPLVT